MKYKHNYSVLLVLGESISAIVSEDYIKWLMLFF